MLIFGTVPEMCWARRVSDPAACFTPPVEAARTTHFEEKLSWLVPPKVSASIFEPGLASRRLRPGPGPAWLRRRARSAGLRFWKPPLPSPLIVSGRVTVMSVPTPVRGWSTFCWAWSRPLETALVVMTKATPTASPSAVRIVRPRRRRSSASM